MSPSEGHTFFGATTAVKRLESSSGPTISPSAGSQRAVASKKTSVASWNTSMTPPRWPRAPAAAKSSRPPTRKLQETVWPAVTSTALSKELPARTIWPVPTRLDSSSVAPAQRVATIFANRGASTSASASGCSAKSRPSRRMLPEVLAGSRGLTIRYKVWKKRGTLRKSILWTISMPVTSKTWVLIFFSMSMKSFGGSCISLISTSATNFTMCPHSRLNRSSAASFVS
mmetsp:Transcript_33912/g.68403  ORF Transcript_33912/g.68403 Transcript_33912/m.68403 type:complete len:228 (+) Transcript_33912:268-951(+)